MPGDPNDYGPMPARRGRGARTNPATRFDARHRVEDPDALDADARRQADTRVLRDTTRAVLSRNDSPDLSFTYSLNPYRGCSHGCPYCYARPYHEYLGHSAGLDFETVLYVKAEAPRLLAETFQKPSWTPQVVSLSGATDPYQPVEREWQVTRGCLEVFLRHRNPVSIITKGSLLLRDLDLLAALAERRLVQVMVSVTTLDDALAGTLEPRAARPSLRLKMIEALAEAGVPVGVGVAPVIPGLTDEEVPRILEAAAARGATRAFYQLLRLPGAVETLFVDWLARGRPLRKEKVLSQLRAYRGGPLSDDAFGSRWTGRGVEARLLAQLFAVSCRKHGLNEEAPLLDATAFRRLSGGQRDLFETS